MGETKSVTLVADLVAFVLFTKSSQPGLDLLETTSLQHLCVAQTVVIDVSEFDMLLIIQDCIIIQFRREGIKLKSWCEECRIQFFYVR